MITLSAEGISVSMSPERGGKITSLNDTQRAREWLEPSDGELSGPVARDASFDEGDMCGWDEVMPTIEACRHPVTGAPLGDHGELWRQSWTVTARSPDSVTTSVGDEVLGYRLERTLRVSPHALRVDYRVVTEASDLPLLWAAHPLFAARAGTRVFADVEPLDLAGRPWPAGGVAVSSDLAAGSGRKVFLRPRGEQALSWLVDLDGSCLSLRWPRQRVPFLGLWLDHCSLSRHPVVGIEPTNGCDDSLAAAYAVRSEESAAALCLRRWSLVVSVGTAPEDGSTPTRGGVALGEWFDDPKGEVVS